MGSKLSSLKVHSNISQENNSQIYDLRSVHLSNLQLYLIKDLTKLIISYIPAANPEWEDRIDYLLKNNLNIRKIFNCSASIYDNDITYLMNQGKDEPTIVGSSFP